VHANANTKTVGVGRKMGKALDGCYACLRHLSEQHAYFMGHLERDL